MSVIDILILMVGIALIVGSLSYTYERSALLFGRKYSACPRSLLSSQYLADGLLLFRYFIYILFGMELMCLATSPSLGTDVAFFANLLCVSYVFINGFCYEYFLKTLFKNLEIKWEDGVNYDSYTDEVNLYRAIRDTQRLGILTFVCVIQMVILLFTVF